MENKELAAARRKKWAEANPEKNKAAKRRWAEANRDYHARKTREYGERHVDRVRANKRRVHLKNYYGITPEQYDALLLEQDARCSICGTNNPGRKDKHWSIDHDHETGKVRALLCHSCNVGLGHFEDNPDLLKKALDYLIFHKTT